MSKYLIEVDVNEDKLRRSKGIDVGEENEYEESIETLIFDEMGWVGESGIYVSEVTEIPENKKSIPSIDNLGVQISNIINQDGDDVSDGQVIDQIVELLKENKLYSKREE
jgi:hypothetical protein